MKMANFLIDRLIALGVSRICDVPGDYNLEFLELLVVYEIDRVLQACWREKRFVHLKFSSDISQQSRIKRVAFPGATAAAAAVRPAYHNAQQLRAS